MEWQTKEILVLVKAYPNPSQTYGETVCTAGITKNREWIRLYPVTFRDLKPEKQYKKFEWIRVQITKASEKLQRPESYKLNPDTIEKIGYIPSGDKYIGEREKYFQPMVSENLETLEEKRDKKTLSLGAFKPSKVQDFVIEKGESSWSKKQTDSLNQGLLYNTKKTVLEKIPYNFKYKFQCNNKDCNGHTISIIDWEICEAYRNFSRIYSSENEALSKLKDKYLNYFFKERNSYFIVGTESHFNRFLILSVYSTKKDYQPLLNF